MDESSYSQTLDHAKSALSNIQQNVRFVDTKVGVVMGLIVIFLGVVFERGDFAAQIKKDVLTGGFLSWVDFALLSFLLVSLIALVGFAILTIFPRNTKDPRVIARKWILFPLPKNDVEAALLRVGLTKELLRGLSRQTILVEYAEQLAIVGYIQYQKMKWCRRMMVSAAAFSGAVLLLGIICFVRMLRS